MRQLLISVNRGVGFLASIEIGLEAIRARSEVGSFGVGFSVRVGLFEGF